MTIYFPDISSYQGNISLGGALFVCAKATESTNYFSQYFNAQKAEATRRGTWFTAYHFLHAGNAAAQADYCYSRVGSGPPLMLDAEAEGTSRPGVGDINTFIDRYRSHGGKLHLLYLPHWYWQSIGSPSLNSVHGRGMRLWSSAYVGYTDSNSGTGWQGYGGMGVDIWQYTSGLPFNGQKIDFNAFRGDYAGKQDSASVAKCKTQLENLFRVGKWNP